LGFYIAIAIAIGDAIDLAVDGLMSIERAISRASITIHMSRHG
jgi:hypothetical protein